MTGDIGMLGPLWPAQPEGLTERRCYRRQASALELGRRTLRELVEPWATSEGCEEVVERCVALHLYARVLDDALDEALPIQRRLLLRVQPLFWKTVQALALAYPSHLTSMSATIREVTSAVDAEWVERRVSSAQAWAQKNHHLLLAPMLLSNDNECFRHHKPDLSRCLLLLQATEEHGQGSSDPFDFAKLVGTADWIDRLDQAGWHTLAHRATGLMTS